MKAPWWIALLTTFAAPALAQQTPPPVVVPLQQQLVYRHFNTTGVTVDDGTHEVGGYLADLGTRDRGGRLMLGSSLADFRLRDHALHIAWLPVSLVVVPYRATSTFAKTGAASVSATQTLPSVTNDLGGGRTEVITRRSRTYTRLPEAKTTFTYSTTMVYLSASANLGDLVDFSGPRRLTNERISLGVLRGRHADIPNGVDYDINKALSRADDVVNRAYAPNQGVSVTTRGIEIGRALERGKRGWYISYVIGTQAAPRKGR